MQSVLSGSQLVVALFFITMKPEMVYPKTNPLKLSKPFLRSLKGNWNLERMSWSVDSASSVLRKRKNAKVGILQLVKI